MRSRAWTIGLTVAAAFGAIAVATTMSWPSDPVERVEIRDPAGHWQHEGFVEMVPPIRLPSSKAESDDVAIWLKLPENGVITTRWSEARRDWVLEFPPGTIADRVEQRGAGDKAGVVDVRGTRLGADGEEWMHALRRAQPDINAPMFGYEWPRSNPDAHMRATDRLLAELETVAPAKHMGPDARARFLDGVRRKNQCSECHVHARPDNTVEGEHGLVNRGTDGSGFFTPQTVLADAIVLERYGGVDPNLRDPAVRIECPDGQPTLTSKNQRERGTCRNHAVPLGRIDYRLVDNERLERICRSRKYLLDHLDARGKQVFAEALRPCER